MSFYKKIVILFIGAMVANDIQALDQRDVNAVGDNLFEVHRYSLAGVEDILIRGPFVISIVQTEEESLSISKEKNLNKINISVENKKLIVTADGAFDQNEKINCKIGVKKLRSIDLINVISCNLKKYKSSEPLSISVAGESFLSALLYVPTLSITAHGPSCITLKGQTEELRIICSGGVQCDTLGLKNKDVFLNVGRCDLKLAADRSIAGIQGGGSTIFYTKNPLVEVKTYSSNARISKKSARIMYQENVKSKIAGNSRFFFKNKSLLSANFSLKDFNKKFKLFLKK